MLRKLGIGMVALWASAALLAAGCSDDDNGAECGDGVMEGNEVCDGADLGGEDCVSQGFVGGTLACNTTCDGYDTSQCTSTPCGNGDIDTGEVCDTDNFGTATCVSEGFDGGDLSGGAIQSLPLPGKEGVG